MATKLFVLGRPGSGKTTTVRHLIELAKRRNYTVMRLKEYDILYPMFQEHMRIGRHDVFRPVAHGGFDIIDFSILDESLRQLEDQIAYYAASSEYDIVTIELARDNYQTDLRAFSDGFLRDAYFLFIEAELETCIQRIQERIIPDKPDHHFVSEAIIRTHYHQDFWHYMAHDFACEYGIQREVKVYRNLGTKQALIDMTSDFAERLFAQEIVRTQPLVNEPVEVL